MKRVKTFFNTDTRKSECPTFHMIVDKLADYFNMDVKATRLNWSVL